MEMTFSELRTKEVVNTADGRKLGKICDMVFCYPENKILGFIVPGQRSFGMKKSDFFIDLKNIVKIGDDVVLVNVGCARAPANRQKSCPPNPTPRSQSPTPYSDGGYGSYGGGGNSSVGNGNGQFSARRSFEDYE